MSIVMGIDHGNGHVKARAGQRKLNLPSVYARPYEESEGYATAGVSAHIHSFEIEGAGIYLWGKDIVADADMIYASYGNRYTSNEFRTLSSFAVSLLLPQNRLTTFENITVVTGYPSLEKGTRQEEELIEAFKGEHRLVVDGQLKVANVERVYTLPQPLGTIMSLYLDDDGYVADESYETSYCGIIDIGSGTTDLDGVKRLKRQQDDFTTITRGMLDVYRKVAELIYKRSEARVNPTPQKVEQQILAGHKEYVHSDRLVVPMEDLFEAQVNEFVAFLKNQIEQKWKTEKLAEFDRIILTGGGASSKYVAKAFESWQSDIIVLRDSQEANATGFYRYGKFKTREGE